MLLLQGAHQVAQKSMITGRPRSSDMRYDFPSTVWSVNSGAASPAL